MQIKSPACFDVSHYKEILNFKLVSPKPVLFITKATEAYPNSGYYHTDDKFIRFFKGMIEIGVIRGVYHFFRNKLDPTKQAQHFVNTISQVDILPTDLLILDVEEYGNKASQLWAWFEYVKKAFPNNRLVLYSRRDILNQMVMTQGERDYFKQMFIWTAGYPYLPDIFSKVPISYVPDQTKFGKVVLWQYSEKGVVQGIQGAVDLNWIEPNFYSTLGDNTMAEEVISFTGKCIDGNNKVWDTIGGEVQTSIKLNTSVSGDKRSTVAGILYLHLTSPVVGWTKKQWFDVTYGTTPPPTQPPDQPTKTHTIDVFTDGKISVDGNVAF